MGSHHRLGIFRDSNVLQGKQSFFRIAEIADTRSDTTTIKMIVLILCGIRGLLNIFCKGCGVFVLRSFDSIVF